MGLAKFSLMVFIFGAYIGVIAQELQTLYPQSKVKPYISVEFDKTVDLAQYKSLAIVGLETSLDPQPTEMDRQNTIELILSGYERNLAHMGFNLIERIKIETIVEEMRMSLAGVTSEKDAIKVGELLSANIVCIITISGSARNQNDALFQTSFKIIEVETGKILITGMFINAVDGLAKLFDKLSSDYLANRAYLNIQQAVEYMNQSNYDSAVVSFQTALNYLRSQEDAESLKVVGILYNNIGATFQKNEMWSKALEYFKKSINHNSRIGKNEPVLSLTHQHLCEIYIANSDYKNAEKHGKKAVAINKANNDLTGECEAMHLLLSVYEMNSNKRQARRIKKRMDELLCG